MLAATESGIPRKNGIPKQRKILMATSQTEESDKVLCGQQGERGPEKQLAKSETDSWVLLPALCTGFGEDAIKETSK